MAESLKRLLSDKARTCGCVLKRLALTKEPIQTTYGLFSPGA